MPVSKRLAAFLQTRRRRELDSKHWFPTGAKPKPLPRGTGSSNPALSGGESAANLQPGRRRLGRQFFSWWIDPESGRPIPERAGVLRYFVRIAEKIVWADRPEELMIDLLQGQELPPGIDPPLPMSVTFIPATVFDNLSRGPDDQGLSCGPGCNHRQGRACRRRPIG